MNPRRHALRSLHWATLLAMAAFASVSLAGDALNGEVQYKARCAVCHSIDFNGVGPAHKGVFGRKAAQAKGYTYSPALNSASLTWNEATLDRWLTDPEKLVPGQKMGTVVDDATTRADLIAYLKKFSATK